MNEIEVSAPAAIADLLEIVRPAASDARGWFMATHVAGELDRFTKEPIRFIEDDVSRSRRGVLRGLHADFLTWKLVQCLWGEVFFAVADLRRQSPTYGKAHWTTLHAESGRQILVPPGCGNGHQCLSEQCLFAYKQSRIYSGAAGQLSVCWNDPALAIPWPISDPILSPRDLAAPCRDLP
jgi:dTDP-4-dehydrorhamnose 3,5-epimerase